MKFRIVFCDVLPCIIIIIIIIIISHIVNLYGEATLRCIRLLESLRINSSLMMEATRTSETSVDNYFTRQYIPEDNSEIEFIFYNGR
jgi:hypothetical protein